MALRTTLLALCFAVGCGKDKTDKATPVDLDTHCETMALSCGDKDKHIQKITTECKESIKVITDKGCAPAADALYSCYEKQVCSGKDRVWTLDDLRVLAGRHSKCVVEQMAVTDCVAGKKK
jgi:hypothetical protein